MRIRDSSDEAVRSASSGLDVRYEEANDGHHWENWRDRLQSALHWTLGRGPSRDERTPAPR